MIRYSPYIPRWSSLGNLGKNRILKTSYIWLVLVPLAANFFLKLGPEITIPLWEEKMIFTLGLPFSWKMFYFSAVAFALGSIIYAIRCPSIVSDYERYSEFTDQGKGQEQLKVALRKSVRGFSGGFIQSGFEERVIMPFIKRYCEKLEENHAEIEVWENTAFSLLEKAKILPGRDSDAFWYVRSHSDTSDVISRVLCALFYLIGFVLIGIVLAQNFNYVWQFVG